MLIIHPICQGLIEGSHQNLPKLDFLAGISQNSAGFVNDLMPGTGNAWVSPMVGDLSKGQEKSQGRTCVTTTILSAHLPIQWGEENVIEINFKNTRLFGFLTLSNLRPNMWTTMLFATWKVDDVPRHGGTILRQGQLRHADIEGAAYIQSTSLTSIIVMFNCFIDSY